MMVLFTTKATFADGEIVEDTVTNDNFKSAAEVEDFYMKEFGADLVDISVKDMRHTLKDWRE